MTFIVSFQRTESFDSWCFAPRKSHYAHHDGVVTAGEIERIMLAL